MLPSFSLNNSTIDYFYFVIAFLVFLYLLEAFLDKYYFDDDVQHAYDDKSKQRTKNNSCDVNKSEETSGGEKSKDE